MVSQTGCEGWPDSGPQAPVPPLVYLCLMSVLGVYSVLLVGLQKRFSAPYKTKFWVPYKIFEFWVPDKKKKFCTLQNQFLNTLQKMGFENALQNQFLNTLQKAGF